ncbi:hypothetical protein FHS57_005115 [Runella defluvii]|uniref:DUF1289 domain-containing protein n=1 Tax=Runella defluvii TaxID=370973 RepID=A0A7W6ESV2_9BACT|nr:hypothetical protein [Runella defluvii]MBB3841094.1 hypothetical protein [Runella defluvii]
MENTPTNPTVSVLDNDSTGKPMFFKKCDVVRCTEKGTTICQGCHQSQSEFTYFVINNLSGKPMASFRNVEKRDEYHAKMKPSDQERFRPDKVTIKFLD